MTRDTSIDAYGLSRWLDDRDVVGHGGLPSLNRLSAGSQNTLYLIERGGARMVMRYAANVTSEKSDPRIVEAFGSMVMQSIATAADMACSLPSTVR